MVSLSNHERDRFRLHPLACVDWRSGPATAYADARRPQGPPACGGELRGMHLDSGPAPTYDMR